MTAHTYTPEHSIETQHLSPSMPRIVLQLEGLAILIGIVALYTHISGDWLAFAVLLLVPDVSTAAYLVNQRIGSITYNAVHFYGVPFALGLMALSTGWTTGIALALIWAAHIALDRTFGLGMKYANRPFSETHFTRL